jgi:peptide/nickel transport system permease protein
MRYLVHRIGFFIITVWVCLTINFVLPRLMPGNAADAAMSRLRGTVSPGAVRAYEIAFGVTTHVSLVDQYFEYLRNVFTGNFGVSITFFPDEVLSVILSALPWTLGLVGLTTVVAFLAGTLIGVVSGWRHGGHFDNWMPPLFIITSAFPYFFVALVTVLVFAVKLGWFPEEFAYSTGVQPSASLSFIGDVLEHAALPAVTIVITSIGGWVLTMRNNMITTISADYIRVARAKGLSPNRIMFNYAARNAILPNLTGFAIALGFVVSGAILVEYVFAYPGVGYMLLQAVENNDYALMQALFLFITMAVLVCVLLMDLVTGMLDPRVRSGRISAR